MIYVTGDVHCPIDVSKLNRKNFPKQKELTKDDYVIVCGDMGIVWANDNTDKYWQKWFNEQNYTLLFVDGNHENHPALNAYPIVEFAGGRAHQIKDSVFHLMRGEVYTLQGKTFWCFGGAESHDKYLRTEGKDWWPEEVASWEEMNYGIENLAKYENKVDYIITHDCPYELKRLILKYNADKDPMVSYFDFISQNVEFKHWFFGHYHIDQDFSMYHCLYDNVKEISEYD